jgi:hypothetical protein
VSAAPETGARELEKWIVVDLERILRLPERLRRLWPPDLAPRLSDEGIENDEGIANDSDSGSADRTGGSRSHGGDGENVGTASAGEEVVDLDDTVSGSRELDVLTAWVTGFAAELNQSESRVSVVVSSGVETVHLAFCLGVGTCQAVLMLRGEGLEDFAHHQLLRRVDPRRIGRIVDELAELVEHDCVLTLNWASRGGAAGLEFLHRRGGTWFRPVLERSGGSITVDADVEAGDDAVRMLLTAVLARVLTTGAPR